MTASLHPPHVLLLPGNMCDGRLWTGGDGVILKAIEECGLSVSCLDFDSDASIEDMAERGLNQQAGPLIPMGFSMGGIVALEMAKRAPSRMVAMALIDTTSHADTRGLERVRQQKDVRDGKLKQVVRLELKPNYLARCNAPDEGLLNLLCDMAMDLGPEVFIAQSEALRTRIDLTPVLGDICVPVMVACGREDMLCPPALHQTMTSQIKHARLTVVEDAGHILPLERPDILAKLIFEFLTTTLGPKL